MWAIFRRSDRRRQGTVGRRPRRQARPQFDGLEGRHLLAGGVLFDLWTGVWELGGLSNRLGQALRFQQNSPSDVRGVYVSPNTGAIGTLIGSANGTRLSGEVIDPLLGPGTFSIQVDPTTFHSLKGSVTYTLIGHAYNFTGTFDGPAPRQTLPTANPNVTVVATPKKVRSDGSFANVVHVQDQGLAPVTQGKAVLLVDVLAGNKRTGPAIVSEQIVPVDGIDPKHVGSYSQGGGVLRYSALLLPMGPDHNDATLVIRLSLNKFQPTPTFIISAFVQDANPPKWPANFDLYPFVNKAQAPSVVVTVVPAG
jgi:hypothetical protein